jgi:hypothetical protein
MLSCSSPSLEGLWIEKNNRALLKFFKDSVINYTLPVNLVRDTLGYVRTRDSISWTGLDPRWNQGKTIRTYKYTVAGDSLLLWYQPDAPWVYLKSSADNYLHHFLSKGDVQVALPFAQSAMQPEGSYAPINIRIGYRGDEIKIFVFDRETGIYELHESIKSLKARAAMIRPAPPEVIGQLFIDEKVPCEYVFWLFAHLRAGGIRRVSFVTLSKEYDSNTPDFRGLQYTIPENKVVLVEKN